MSETTKVNVVVLGAGVIGLTSALRLAEDKRLAITIVSRDMPGDYDIEYASPWAGANYLPVGKPGSLLQKLERDSFPELYRLATQVPAAAIHLQNNKIFARNKDNVGAVADWFSETTKRNPWFKDVVPNFRQLNSDELPTGQDYGTSFTSLCINTAVYLSWLVGQCLAKGVVVKRGTAKSISHASTLHSSGHKADIVINCTALGARKLGGVEDSKVFPGRGQIVIVRNSPGFMLSTSGTDDGSDEALYIMERAAGGGTVLGGCLQKNNSESQPDPNLALRIMKRAVTLCPSLTNGKGIEALDIVRHAVGLRPMREGGPRVESEVIQGTPTVHCYGHAGYGYQSSYGSANMVVKLVEEIIGKQEKARL